MGRTGTRPRTHLKVEEHLRDDAIGACVALLLEVVELLREVGVAADELLGPVLAGSRGSAGRRRVRERGGRQTGGRAGEPRAATSPRERATPCVPGAVCWHAAHGGRAGRPTRSLRAAARGAHSPDRHKSLLLRGREGAAEVGNRLDHVRVALRIARHLDAEPVAEVLARVPGGRAARGRAETGSRGGQLAGRWTEGGIAHSQEG